MAEKVCAHVIVRGRVQGVFFRMETFRAAERHGVNGWVRNLRGGDVEAVFEGSRQAVEDMLAWTQHGPPAARVAQVETKWQPPQGLEGFEIRY